MFKSKQLWAIYIIQSQNSKERQIYHIQENSLGWKYGDRLGQEAMPLRYCTMALLNWGNLKCIICWILLDGQKISDIGGPQLGPVPWCSCLFCYNEKRLPYKPRRIWRKVSTTEQGKFCNSQSSSICACLNTGFSGF